MLCAGGLSGLAALQWAAAGSGLLQQGLSLELWQVPCWRGASTEGGGWRHLPDSPHSCKGSSAFFLLLAGGSSGLAALQWAAAGGGLLQRGLSLELWQVPCWRGASTEGGGWGQLPDCLAVLPENLPDR